MTARVDANTRLADLATERPRSTVRALDGLRTDVSFDATAAAVYDAIAAPGGTNGWWTTDGDVVKAPGQLLRLNWSATDHIVFRIDRADRPSLMRWTCVAQHDRNLPRPDEWVGTTLTFSLGASDRTADLRFTHHGLVPALDCFDMCEGGWNFFLRRSLKQLVEVGRGLPYDAGTSSPPAPPRR